MGLKYYVDYNQTAQEIKRRFHSLEALTDVLTLMVDFNRDKLINSLFEYACKSLEDSGVDPKTNGAGIDFLIKHLSNLV